MTAQMLFFDIFPKKTHSLMPLSIKQVHENIEQVNSGLIKQPKIKIKLLENENKLLGEERDNDKKLLDTISKHNVSLLRVHRNPTEALISIKVFVNHMHSMVLPTKLKITFSIRSYQPIYAKKVKSNVRKLMEKLQFLIEIMIKVVYIIMQDSMPKKK